MSDWVKVVYASDCDECEMCGEPVCPVCKVHYFECDCPSPTQDDEYEYREIDGVEMARKICHAQ